LKSFLCPNPAHKYTARGTPSTSLLTYSCTPRRDPPRVSSNNASRPLKTPLTPSLCMYLAR
jgi:hypothetical protein